MSKHANRQTTVRKEVLLSNACFKVVIMAYLRLAGRDAGHRSRRGVI